MTDTAPVIAASPPNLRDGWIFTVLCPHCGNTHNHGGGRHPSAERARTFLGLRASHCDSSGYLLTDPHNHIGRAQGGHR